MKNNQLRSLSLLELIPIISFKSVNGKSLMLSQILRHKLLLSCLILLITVTASAQTVTVNTALDENNGVTTSIANLIVTPGGAGISLREAVIAANNEPAGATISIIVPAGTYNLSLFTAGETSSLYNAASGDLDLLATTVAATSKTVNLIGAGAATTIINQTVVGERVIELHAGTAAGFPGSITFSATGTTFSGGTPASQGGGAILAGRPGDVTSITSCTFNSNSASNGGAISQSSGNAVHDLTITNSTFTNNTCTGGGGAVSYTGLGNASISGCTFSGNTAASQGGAINIGGGAGANSVNILRNNFVNNTANGTQYGGAAVAIISAQTVNINFNRLFNNTSPNLNIGLLPNFGDGRVITDANTPSTIGTLNVDNNWWGVNTGPVTTANSRSVFGATPTRWLNLRNTASPSPICVGATSTITASFLSNNLSEAIAPANLTALVGQPITFNTPVNGTLSAAQTSIQATGTATVTFTATGAGAGSANSIFVPTAENFSVTTSPTITINAANSAGAPSSNPTVCVNTAISPSITIATTGATGIGAPTGLPAGVSAVWAGNVITISGTPTTTVGSPFSYSIPLTGGCGGGNTTGTITVNAVNTVTLSSAPGTNAQTVAINTPITNITYNTTGATGATVTGLPPGVTGNWAANVVTISGSPTSAAGSPYVYTVTLNGGCGTVTNTGTITVTTCAVTLTSAPGTNAQTVCINTPITNITYATVGATGATFSGLPAGVTGNWVADVITISGTPTTTVGSPFTYTITQVGGACAGTTATGTITVNPNNTITLTSAAGTNAQTVCINTPITNITYSTTGATGATFSGLPAGVTGAWAANVVTISGSPTTTVGSPFSYTVTLTGGCGTITTTGTITVNPLNTITLTSGAGTNAQTVAINSAITNITYATTGATGATFSGLPTGVTGNLAANVVTISGSPSTAVGSPFSYTVTLTGGCGTITATGSIAVNPCTTPTVTCPGNISLNNTTNTCGRVVTYTTTTGGTPAPTVTYALTGATTASGSGDGSGSTFNVGVTNVTVTATNTCMGNALAVCSFSVNITDNQPPNVTAGTIGSCYPSVSAAQAAALAATSATDNCPGTITKTASTVGTCSAVITVTATDANSNAASVTYNTRIDNTAPTVTVGTIGSCYPSVSAAETAALAATSATDNCQGTLNKTASTVGTCSAVITVTTTDGCGNATAVTYNTRIDNTAPTVTVGTIGSCYPTVAAAEAAALAATSTTDNCPGSLTKVASTVGTCSAVVTVTTTDGCGNATAVTYNTRIDNTAPTITVGTIASCYQTVSAAETAALAATSATDNCPGALTKVASTVGTCAAVVTVTTTDGCGNATAVTYNTRIDNTAPTVTVGTIGSCYPTVATAEAAALAATSATDNCSGALTETASTVGTCSAVITVTTTDGCNATAVTYNTRIDNTAPTVTVGTIASCYPSVSAAETAALAATSATDNCPGALTKIASTVGTCSAVVTVTTTDGCGNATAVTYNTRIDNTAPTVTVGTIGSCYPTVAAAEAAALAATSATDNCPGTLTKVASTVGTCAAVVTVTTTDGCGNATAVTYNTRIDNTAPTVTVGSISSCYPTVAAAEAAALAATLATDNCPGALTKIASTVGTCSAVVTVTTTDGCGNATAVTYNTRIDNTAPTVTVGTIGSCYPTVAAAQAAALAATSATDNCPGTLTKIASTVGTCSAVVTVTTTDGCSNATAVTYNTRIDNTPPTITCPNPIVVCDPASVPIPNTASVSATDNCSGAITITHIGDVNNCPSCVNTSYTISRTYRATDACGNFAECTQIITVNISSVAPTGISGTTTICQGNSTTLTMVDGSAGTGAVAEWFTGSCGGTSAGTGNSIIVAPTVTTTYFVRYKGTCNTTSCASVTVIVNSPSVGGTVAPANTQGCGPQTVNLSVSGINGTVTQWERQTNCTGAWASIGNAGLTTITVTTPNSSTCYRAVVTNGVCPEANSSVATVTVDKPAVGGRVTLQSNQTATSIALCPSQNATLIPKGYVGMVAIWQYTFGTSSIWYDLPGTEGQTTLTVNGSSIAGTVFYRVVIVTESGICTGQSSVAYSTAFRITKKAGCSSPDGSITNTEITTGKRFTVTKAYPNPASDLISLELENFTEGSAQIDIMDVTGRQVLKQTATLTEGMNSISLDISHLSRGVFIIKMTDSQNQKAMVKMVKE